jgi:hypothetical protein
LSSRIFSPVEKERAAPASQTTETTGEMAVDKKGSWGGENFSRAPQNPERARKQETREREF